MINLKHVPSTGILLLLCISLSGCYASKQEYLKLENEFNSLKKAISSDNAPAQQRQIQTYLALEEAQQTIANQADRLDKLERNQIKMITAVERTNIVDLITEVTELRKSLELQFSLDLPQGKFLTEKDLSEIKAQKKSKIANKKITAAETLFDKAYENLENQEFQKSLQLWNEFIENFPEHAQSPEALFWKGETLFQLNDFPASIIVFEDLKKRFPKHVKIPASILKQGIAFYSLDKKEPADILFKQLQNDYPDSLEAVTAKNFIEKRSN